MTNPPSPKSLARTPSGPRAAQPAAPGAVVGEPKGAARKGVVTALRSDAQPTDGRRVVAWLHITAPRGAVPTAVSRCACGRDRSTAGHRRVLALITEHEAHRDTCPLRTTQEGSTAA